MSILTNIHQPYMGNPLGPCIFLITNFIDSITLISASKECLKVRFRQKNKEILPLECRRLSLKSRNEKPLIRKSIGSFKRYVELDYMFSS